MFSIKGFFLSINGNYTVLTISLGRIPTVTLKGAFMARMRENDS